MSAFLETCVANLWNHATSEHPALDWQSSHEAHFQMPSLFSLISLVAPLEHVLFSKLMLQVHQLAREEGLPMHFFIGRFPHSICTQFNTDEVF